MTAERFPTIGRIPIHPEPGIFETTVALTESGVVDHVEVERVMARPSWSFAEASARFERERWLRQVDANTEHFEQMRRPADRTKKGPTPKRGKKR